MAVRKWALVVGFSISLMASGAASARQGDLDSLALSTAAGEATALDTLWSGMEVQADSFWEELAPEIEKQRAYSFAPTGPADRHWAERGVDMAALLARAPGGAAANVLYSDDTDGPFIHALDAAVVAGLGIGWRRVAERHFVPPGGPAFVSLLAITPAHLLVSQEAWEQVGHGYCPTSKAPAPADQITLYRDSRLPFNAQSDRDGEVEGMAFSVWTALSRTQTPRVCWMYVEVAPGLYESRSFDAEGRPLGHMDEATKRLRIVPVADLRAMLTAKAAPVGRPRNSASAQ